MGNRNLVPCGLAALVLATLATARAGDSDRRAIRIDWTPRSGERARLVEEARLEKKLVLRGGERARTDQLVETRLLECDRAVSTVQSDRIAKERRTYAKARLEDDRGADESLVGSTVALERPEGERPRASVESKKPLGPLAGELVEQLKLAPPENASCLAPQAKVAPGDEWDVDVDAALRLLRDELASAATLDRARARARAKLVSVVDHEGHPRGTIELVVTADVTDLPGVGHVDRGTLVVTGKIEATLDGSSADRTIAVTGSLDATVATPGPDGKPAHTAGIEWRETLRFTRSFLP